MKRAAIFAHYDKDNIIDDYVIYYLNSLKDFAENIIFVSCCKLSESEKQKLNGITIIDEPHNEYDFGSYKRGFLYLKNNNILEKFDELIFANDSCFAPLFPFKNMFEEMEKRDCNFWGVTKNKFGIKNSGEHYEICVRPHIQSYFFVCKKELYNSSYFNNFINSIKQQKNKHEIVINYEIGLSELLEKNNVKMDTYVKNYYRFNHVIISLWRKIIKKSKSPFLKCSIMRLMNKDITTIAGWENFLHKNTNYPIELIKKNIERTSTSLEKKSILPIGIKILLFNIMSFCPAKLKRLFAIAIKHLKILSD